MVAWPAWNVDMYEPGVERMGFEGGTGGGPVGVVELILLCQTLTILYFLYY